MRLYHGSHRSNIAEFAGGVEGVHLSPMRARRGHNHGLQRCSLETFQDAPSERHQALLVCGCRGTEEHDAGG
jgi:hypothetical protein